MKLKTIYTRALSLMTFALPLASYCDTASDPIVATNEAQGNPNPLDELLNHALDSNGNLNKWQQLQSLSSGKLTSMLINADDPVENGWIRLALISKEKNLSNKKLVAALMNWRDQNPSHPASSLFPDNDTLLTLTSTETPRRIAVLLPEKGPYAAYADTIHKGIMDAYAENPALQDTQHIVFYNTTGWRSIASVYNKAVKDGADFIIGPLTKDEVQELNHTANFTVPVLALNYSSADNTVNNFYEFGLLPEDDVAQIAVRANNANLSHALIIAENNAWGKRLSAAFKNEWASHGGKVEDTWYFAADADFNTGIAKLLHVNINEDNKLSRLNSSREQLEKQRRQDFDVIILFAKSRQANLIVPMLKFYYAGNIPVYATSAVYTNKISVANHDLNGVIVCDTPASLLASTNKPAYLASNKLYAVGQDAYRLSQTMQRMTILPNFPIYSSTGALVIDQKQQVHRHLPCVAIKDLDQYAANR